MNLAPTLRVLGRPFGMLGLALASAVVFFLGSGRRAPEPPPPSELGRLDLAVSAGFPASSASAAPDEPEESEDAPTCGIPDPGKGRYGAWQTLPLGRMVVPQPPPRETYDLLLHFHGGEAVRRVLAAVEPFSEVPLVIAALDAGVGSQAYAESFAGAQPLEELLGTVDSALAPARLRYLVVSAWSAGYGAVREMLREHPTVANAVVLLDSVHTSYEADGATPVKEGVAPFLSFARRAQASEAVMVLTHSDIRPPGYASTTEVATTLIAELGGRRAYGGLLPAHGIELKTRYDAGLMHVLGYSGSSKEAHCAQLSLLPDILRNDVFPALR
jgi:hypothetical protein